MLRNGEANPLSVHGLRELDHCPPHFVKVIFDVKGNVDVVNDWIWENLEGRFWVGDYYSTNSSGKVELFACAAFENAGEASMFSLCLDQIQSSNLLI